MPLTRVVPGRRRLCPMRLRQRPRCHFDRSNRCTHNSGQHDLGLVTHPRCGRKCDGEEPCCLFYYQPFSSFSTAYMYIHWRCAQDNGSDLIEAGKVAKIISAQASYIGMTFLHVQITVLSNFSSNGFVESVRIGADFNESYWR